MGPVGWTGRARVWEVWGGEPAVSGGAWLRRVALGYVWEAEGRPRPGEVEGDRPGLCWQSPGDPLRPSGPGRPPSAPQTDPRVSRQGPASPGAAGSPPQAPQTRVSASRADRPRAGRLLGASRRGWFCPSLCPSEEPGTSGTPEPLGPASRRPPGLRSPLSPVKPKECLRGATLGAQAPESRGQGHLRVPPRVPGQPEGPRQPGRPQRPVPRPFPGLQSPGCPPEGTLGVPSPPLQARASPSRRGASLGPHVQPHRDPSGPDPPTGPSLCPPAPLQPSLHPRPQLLASPGPPGQPEGPRQPGRVAFPLPWPLLPASHPSPLSLPPHRVHQAGRRDPGGPVSVPPAAAQSLPPGKGASFSPPSLRPRLLCTVCKVQPPTPVHGSRAQPRPPLPTVDRPSVHPGHPRPPVSTPVPSRGDFM